MTIRIETKTEKCLLDSSKRFFAEELDEDIGGLKAGRVLDSFVRKIASSDPPVARGCRAAGACIDNTRPRTENRLTFDRHARSTSSPDEKCPTETTELKGRKG